ncbi:MAG: hypothetical protein ABH832_02285 [bacterium]
MSDNNTQQNSAEEQEILDAAQALGARIGHLIFIAPLSDDDRAEIIKALPFLNAQEMDDLANMLEQAVKQSSGDVAKDKLNADIAGIIEDYQSKKKVIDENAMEELNDIERELDELGV